MNHPTYSPLLLQAQVVIPAAGEMGIADSTRLENPFQGPMMLDEIRFTLVDAGNDPGVSWSSIYCKLLLGNTPLTQGNVPIGLFGKALNDDVDQTQGQGKPDRFTWKLPKPLFIPARDYLRPIFFFNPYSGAASVTLNVMYSVRPLPVGTPAPAKLQIPWVAAYVPPWAPTGQAAGDRVDSSQPSDLYNPFDQDLHVQRFVGRLFVQSGAQVSDPGEDNGYMGIASASIPMQAYGPDTEDATGTLVTAQDSFNNILVRDPTPFAALFNAVDRAWTVNCVLPPKGFYQFLIERFWSQYPANGVIMTVGISMVGWRDVFYAQRGP